MLQPMLVASKIEWSPTTFRFDCGAAAETRRDVSNPHLCVTTVFVICLHYVYPMGLLTKFLKPNVLGQINRAAPEKSGDRPTAATTRR